MIELKQTQRYFHFVALTGSATDRIRSRFYADQNIERGKPFEVAPRCTLQRLRVKSDYQYHRGILDDNDPDQLIFDGVLYNHKGLDVSLLGFPFKKMIANMVTRLVNKFNLQSTGDFMNVDMAKLILTHETESDQSYGQSQFYLAGVDLIVKGDRYLSTVKLQGDKPLESDLYIKYFKPLVHKGDSRLEKCTMKCKVSSNSQPELPRVVSSLHIDKFGNFKLYVHSDGRNLITLPPIFEFLKSIDCLGTTPYAPTMHTFEPEEEEEEE